MPTSVDGSQAGQDSNLQHTVPKTIVLPIAPPAYTIVACTAAMVTVCAPNHPLGTLRRCRRRRALPACTPPCSAWSATTRWMPQGPEHVPDARRDPHAQRVAYLAYPPGIRTRISTHRGRRAAITPTGHSHPNQTGCKAGMPDSISPAAPRYGVRKLRFKRTVRWVTNPAVKPGRALPSIP